MSREKMRSVDGLATAKKRVEAAVGKNELPSGWEVKSLGEPCEVIAGQSPAGKYYNSNGDGLAFYQGKKGFTEKFIGEPTKWTTHITKQAEAGDILMSVRAPVGPINFSTQPICIGRGLAAIRAGDSMIRGFLFYCLLSKQSEICGNEGAVFASINKKQIEAITIPVPPLAEQERIVGILDGVFEGIATATAHAQRNLLNARELFQSVLQSTFEQKGEDWVEATLGEVLEVQPRNGWSPPAAHHSASGIPVLTLSSVTGFEFRGDKFKYTSADTDSARHYWVNNGDFLITRSNTPELVGHVAIAEGIEMPTIYPDLIMRMNPDSTKALTKFLYWQLRTPSLREIITGRASGANPTMKKINQTAVKTLPVDLPPLPQQKQIVKKLDALSAETRRLEALYQRKLDALAELKQSLLQRAFAGNL